MIGKELKHFKIEKLLGKGGMGVVYRARDVRLDRPVALKVLRADLTANPDRRRRFLQEAKAASAVTHPSIAQIYDVDIDR
jgi:serine/threonine-protein kinase